MTASPAVRLVTVAVHPVKSTAPRHVGAARVHSWGLAGDRRWMVVDRDGTLVSARTEHRLLTVVADTRDTEPGLPAGLRLTAAGHDPLHMDEPGGAPTVAVRLHRHDLYAVPAPPAATTWLREVLARPDVALVWCDDPTRRPLNPDFSRPGDHTAFADGYPLTLATTASLRGLQDWVTETALERGEPPPDPLAMGRFRPNLVLGGDLEPFEEDRWTAVTVGDVRFRVARPSDRCVLTTVDPDTLERGPEPIRTLARHRRWEGRTRFAVNLVPDLDPAAIDATLTDATGPVVHVGDPVTPGVEAPRRGPAG
ncbi:MAG TPA: MOSC N-terminal beta barrel domain-containing protein [Dermatophilaceae bacterium]|nr:MOSC N-terminal beta barrel domain-containing protein [Dermatophilaceae bacterium]